jgi:hypothetical protein
MAHYTARIESSLSVHDAFAYMAAFENVAEWDPGVVEATRLTDGPVHVGTEFRVLTQTGKRRIPLVYRVTDFEEDSRVVVSAATSTLRSIDEIQVTTRGDGSTVTYRANLSLQGLMRIGNLLLTRPLKGIGDRACDGLLRVLNP